MRGLGKLVPEDLELFRKRRLQECLIKVGDMGEVRWVTTNPFAKHIH